MKINNNKYIPIFAALGIGILILFYFTGHWWLQMNDVLFSANGDGIKNYYTAFYHLKYDDNLFLFKGMNYPQGEQVMFTDGHFPLIVILWAIQPVIDLSNYVVLIMNMGMLLSILAAIYFVFKILKEFSVNVWVAAVSSPSIVFLFSGLQRLPGHYSLSWIFFIPLIFYLLILYSQKKKKKYVFILALVVLWFSLMHLYHFAIAAIIVGVFCFYFPFIKKSEIKLRDSALLLVIGVVIPFLLITTLMHFTDNVSDRSTYPYGFEFYKSAWEGVFLPLGNKFALPFMNQWFLPDGVQWEGCNFVGNSSSLFYLYIFGPFAAIPFLFHKTVFLAIAVFTISTLLFFVLKRKYKWHDLSTGNHILNAFLWAGFISLIISFAFPINIFPSLYYKLGPLREIRGIGRMNWIFFFSVNIATIYLVSQRLKSKWIRVSILSIILLLNYYDAYKANSSTLGIIGQKSEWEKLRKEVNESPLSDPDFASRFQAIVTVPFILIGSENITYQSDNHDLMAISIVASWETGLPLVSSILSRTSISQTLDKAALRMEPYTKQKKWFSEIRDSRPFLLLNYPDGRALFEGEELLMQNADTIFNSGKLILASIDKKKWEQILAPKAPQFDTITTEGLYFYKNFESESGKGYGDKGSICLGPIKQPIRIFEEKLIKPLDTAANYELSFWFSNIHEDGLARGTFEIILLDEKDSVVYYEIPNIGQNIHQLDGSWAQFRYRIHCSSAATKLRLCVLHYELKHNSICIDNVMLRDAASTICLKRGSTLVLNNLYYTIKP